MAGILRVAPLPKVSLGALTKYFLCLGTFGFGGPIALAAAMQRDLVVSARLGDGRGVQGGSGTGAARARSARRAARHLPRLGRGGASLGATLAGLAFVAPSFLMVMVLSVFYVRFGGLAWMRGAFYGIGAAVIAIVARGASSSCGSTVGRDPLLWAVVLVNAVVVVWTEAELVWVLALSGLVVAGVAHCASARRPAAPPSRPSAPLARHRAHGPASSETLGKILGFFAKAGVVVFGSGLAVVPFLHGGVVGGYDWLTERQFLDAVAVSMITPGPVVITVAFIGYLVAGPVGGPLAALGVFLPTYLAVVLAAPSSTG